MLSQGFRVQHRSLPSELLITHRSAAGSDSRPPVPILTFLSNVVLETLRVVNQARGSHHKPPALAVGVTLTVESVCYDDIDAGGSISFGCFGCNGAGSRSNSANRAVVADGCNRVI